MQLEGVWQNQNGSVLHIDELCDGVWAGTFESTKGRAARHRRYRVQGVANGNLVAFAVNFVDDHANLHSITNFSGRVEGDVLHTVWVLARAYEDAEQRKPTQPWNTFLFNADRFVKLDGAAAAPAA